MVTLVILDGFGENKNKEGNAIKSAGTPNINKLKKMYPHTLISASGESVGLTEGQMGNSEVGHLNIGAGRIVHVDLTRINNAVSDGSFFKNETLRNAIAHAEKNHSNLHVMGLLSDGGVHSHIKHLDAILELAKNSKIENVYIHAFLDGRDTAYNSGKKFVNELEDKIKNSNARVATIMGRVYAMDREERYDRIKLAYDALVYGVGEKSVSSQSAIEKSYQAGEFDEFMKPFVLIDNAKIDNNDSIIFFNFRTDRARELTKAITDTKFKEFKTKKIKDINFTSMTEYSDDLKNVNVIFPVQKIYDNLSYVLSKNNLTQFRITETTKYAHITFFFNGGIEQPYKGEERVLIESINETDFSAHPKMRAPEILDKLLDAIASNRYDFLLVNFSNPDMIGHTGNFEATKEAISFIDRCAYLTALSCVMAGGECIITADHGNAECMIDKKGEKITSHTTNKVPLIFVSERNKNVKLINNGKLSNIAPTILKLLSIKPPENFDVSMF